MSLFAKAKTLETKAVKPKGSNKTEIAMAGVQSLAEVQAMMKSLAAIAKTMETDIKEAGFGHFLEMDTKVRPESFKAIDGDATSSVQMRKRGANSPLNEDQVEVLQKIGLTPKKDVVQIELFGINPVYAKDVKMMDKVSKALEKIVPEDFFVHQQEVSKEVVDDALLDAAFALKHGSNDRKIALQLCTTMALAPRLNEDYDMSKLAENVTKLLAVDEEQIVEMEAAGAAIIKSETPAATEAPVKRARKAKVAA